MVLRVQSTSSNKEVRVLRVTSLSNLVKVGVIYKFLINGSDDKDKSRLICTVLYSPIGEHVRRWSVIYLTVPRR